MRRSYSSSVLPNSSLCQHYHNDVEVEDGDDFEEDQPSEKINSIAKQAVYSILIWPSHKSKAKKPMVNFDARCLFYGAPDHSVQKIQKYHMSFKFVKGECKLVRNILSAHGLKETHANNVNYNLMWTGTHLKPYTLRALTEYQKVNHFPRSYELTRKDRLYKNIQRMQHAKGFRHFDFIPQSFVLPSELNEFYSAFLKDRGSPWIVKPCASSRGRGIYLINNTNQIPLDENVLICKYLDNPLLVNGFKFDCRIYVAVTSYDPLRIYIYEEGLARFSTVRYEKGTNGNLENHWMHLTNYSINKNSDEYVRCTEPGVDDYGSKWSFSAMLRCLKEAGKDTHAIMARIEDVIIKTIIAGEMAIATACKMFVSYRSNCFELFGFDILLDENLKPWLLEVNLSPSLACDSPLDLQIKANLISDLFNLTGFVCDDPTSKKPPKLLASEARKHQRQHSARYGSGETKAKPLFNDGLTGEERRILRETKEEYKRRGGFIRVYPSPESWELYSSLQEHHSTWNKMLHSKCFPDLWRSTNRPHSATYIARARNFATLITRHAENSLTSDESEGQNFYQRFLQYERKLHANKPFQGDQDYFLSGDAVSSQVHQYVPTQNKVDETSSVTQVHNTTAISKDYESVKLEEIIQKGAYLRRLEAREAFAMYLQRVQHRLLQEISTHQDGYVQFSIDVTQKQEQQIELIHKFLLKAAVNLSNPINIIVPHVNLPLLDRKKILARQLNDFIRVYTKETHLLSEVASDDEISINEKDRQLSSDHFDMFLAIAGESELEELLTVYTKHNKSASIFLGAKPNKQNKKKTVNNGDSKKPQRTDSFNSTNSILQRPKSGRKQFNSSSNSADSHPNYSNVRNFKNNDTRRPNSSPQQKQQIISTVCAYTGANEILKHRQDSMFPSRPNSSKTIKKQNSIEYEKNDKMDEALQNFTLKQAQRNYSSSNSHSSFRGNVDLVQPKSDVTNNDPEQSIWNIRQTLQDVQFPGYLQGRLKKSTKNSSMNSSLESGLDNLVISEPSNSAKYPPHPPDKKKPSIRKSLASQRVTRIFGHTRR